MSNREREEKECVECRSPFFADASSMVERCAQCAHHLYGYDPCEHSFDAGRCSRCGWDGSRSKYIANLVARQSSHAPACPAVTLIVLGCRDLEGCKRFFEALGLQWTSEKHGTGPSHWSCVLDDMVLELYPGADDHVPRRMGFRVASIDDIMPSLRDAGGTVLEHHRGRGLAVVRAPNGANVELSQTRLGRLPDDASIAMGTQTIQIELSGDEALVLYELLVRSDKEGTMPVVHRAETDVLWQVEGRLEKQLPQLFAENYGELLDEARARIRAEREG